MPWLNRELNALMPMVPHQVPHVLQHVLDLIERYPIQGVEFRMSMELYLDTRCAHFQHEFLNFARSVYDMVGYDRVAQYGPPPPEAVQPPPLPPLPAGAAHRTVETLDLSSEEDVAAPSTSAGPSTSQDTASSSTSSSNKPPDRIKIKPYYSLAEIKISDEEEDGDDGIEFLEQVLLFSGQKWQRDIQSHVNLFKLAIDFVLKKLSPKKNHVKKS